MREGGGGVIDSFMAAFDCPASLFCPPQSSRSLTRPTCFTPCAPPPTTTLCCVSAGGATGDTLAPLPAWDRNRRTATPSEARPRHGLRFSGTAEEPPRLLWPLRVSPRESRRHERRSHMWAEEWHQEETDGKTMQPWWINFGIFSSSPKYGSTNISVTRKSDKCFHSFALVTLWIIGLCRLSRAEFHEDAGIRRPSRRSFGSSGFLSPSSTAEWLRLRTNLSD